MGGCLFILAIMGFCVYGWYPHTQTPPYGTVGVGAGPLGQPTETVGYLPETANA